MSRQEHRTKLVASAPCAPGVLLAAFARPAGFDFEPGQHILLELETAEGPVAKPFTLASAPADELLEIGTRLTGSPFKTALEALAPGDEVSITGPLGSRSVPEGEPRVAFLVGGVGITPARSVLRDAIARESGLDVVVFYGNQDQSCVPFAAEFEHMESADPRIRFVHVMAAPLPGWEGETGFITAELVRRHAEDIGERHVVVAGPPAMVEAMDRVTAELGLAPERVTVERFSGYR